MVLLVLLEIMLILLVNGLGLIKPKTLNFKLNT
jgi:hypothetical protein